MNVAAIKKLLEHDITTLRTLEAELLDEKPLSEDVLGEDEGEKLTHITGAIWAKEQSAKNGTPAAKEVRNFITRVRNSISS